MWISESRKMDTLSQLIQACNAGNENAVKRLLSQGSCDVNERDEDGKTGLILSVIYCNEHIVVLLLNHGVKIDLGDKDDMTALAHACSLGYERIILLLIEHGACVNVGGRGGKTPLMEVCMKGHKKLVELLLEHGADMKSTDMRKRTPLMLACMKGHMDIVRLLIGMGADMNGKDSRGWTSLLWACVRRHPDIADYLIKKGAVMNSNDKPRMTPLKWASENGHKRTVEVMIKHGADVNESDWQGVTPLIAACRKGHERVVELLLRRGAKIDTQDTKGRSAVMTALIADQENCFVTLLRAGPNLDLTDMVGCTVFSYTLSKTNTAFLNHLLIDGNLLNRGRLKAVHLKANNSCVCLQPLLMTIDFGVFEWSLCPLKHFKPVARAAFKSGFCPGKIKNGRRKETSPLILSFLENDTELIKTFIRNRYYFPEDYRMLSMNNNVRESIENLTLLNGITRRPLSLQTWSFLTVSKCISLAGPPGQRSVRVDSLQVPHFRKELNFHSVRNSAGAGI